MNQIFDAYINIFYAFGDIFHALARTIEQDFRK